MAFDAFAKVLPITSLSGLQRLIGLLKDGVQPRDEVVVLLRDQGILVFDSVRE